MHMAAWATPRLKAWSLERNLNRIEGERHLKARNYSEAEKYLTLAVACYQTEGIYQWMLKYH